MGRDKATVTVSGVSLLDRLLAGIPAGVPVMIVGPATRVRRVVHRTQEQPPGGGPVAAIAAGLDLVDREVVVVSAVDLPFAGPVLADLADQLAAAPDDVDAVIPIVQGREQPLCAAYRTRSLRQVVAAIAQPAGQSMRTVTSGLRHVPATVAAAAVTDVDTPEELAAVRLDAADIMATTQEVRMQEWITAIAAELGVSPQVDVDAVLDIAKDAAHQVQRPAAPVTTYLVGLAVAAGMTVEEAAAKVHAAAQDWPQDPSLDA